MNSEQDLFDLNTACTHEMERRLGLLGEVAHQDYNYERLVVRAKLILACRGVPPPFELFLPSTDEQHGKRSRDPSTWTCNHSARTHSCRR